MDVAEAFATLELGKHAAITPEAIRRAYLRQVRAHPPERDPEGFRRVREAYELAQRVGAIRNWHGDLRLGGEDFVTCLAEHCAAILQRDHRVSTESAEVQARLREACEFAKRRLSAADVTLVALPSFPTERGPLDLEVRVGRAEFEELCQPLLNRMSNTVLRALRDASAAPERIDEVLLVGGSTRMPCVARLASQLFGKLPLRVLPPDEAVAMGAAIQVALKRGDAAVGDLVVTDIAPFTLGIASGSHTGGTLVSGLFSPIIERGTVLPASRVERFTTVGDGQRKILLEIFQGEHSLCAQNQKLGSYELSGIPAAPSGEEPVDVRFSYDMNGVLDVDATVVSTGKTATFTIESASRLSKKQIEEARARLARLKFHPRDALPNVTALARADALFVELIGQDRARLGAYIASFRGAMDRQDRVAIEAEREALRRVTAELDSQHRVPRP